MNIETARWVLRRTRQAETSPTDIIGLLRGSIAELKVAEAFDGRGDARLGLG